MAREDDRWSEKPLRERCSVLRSQKEAEKQESLRGYIFLSVSLVLLLAGGLLFPAGGVTGLLRLIGDKISLDTVPVTAVSGVWAVFSLTILRKSFQCWDEQRKIRAERLRRQERSEADFYETVRHILSLIERGSGSLQPTEELQHQLPLFGTTSLCSARKKPELRN